MAIPFGKATLLALVSFRWHWWYWGEES